MRIFFSVLIYSLSVPVCCYKSKVSYHVYFLNIFIYKFAKAVTLALIISLQNLQKLANSSQWSPFALLAPEDFFIEILMPIIL